MRLEPENGASEKQFQIKRVNTKQANIIVKYCLTQIMRQKMMNKKSKRESRTLFFYRNHLRRKALYTFLTLIVISLTLISANSNTALPTRTFSAFAQSNTFAQSPTEVIWEKTYGGNGDDRAYYAAPTGDGGFLIAGSTTSIFINRTVAWTVRIGSNGHMLWNRTFPEGDESDFRHVLKTNDGFILIGNTFTSTGNYDGMIVKTDENGNTVWNLTIGNSEIDTLLSGTETSDGIVVVGIAASYSNNTSHAWVIKTSSDGTVLWNKTYGPAGDSAARALVPADNDSCVIAGYTNSTTQGEYEFWIFKIDSEGMLLWNRTYGGSESQKALALAKTADGYLIVGDTHMASGAVNALMIRTDLDGNLEWQKTFGGDNFDSPSDVIPMSSGGFVIAGFTFSWGSGQRDFWLFEINDSGDTVWSCTQGRENYEEAYYVYQTGELEFVLVGWTNSIGNGLYDMYAVKIKVEPRANDFLANILPYVVGGLVAAIALSLGVIGWYFTKKRKVEAGKKSIRQCNLSVRVFHANFLNCFSGFQKL
jgi:hypothetical protein